MKIRILLITILLTLSACRGLLPRDDEGIPNRSAEQTSSSAPITRDSPSVTSSAESNVAPATESGGYLAGDGPGADTPSNLDSIPDAVPRAEPLHRYANRPYAVLGKNYKPLTEIGKYKERGVASWYGKKFHGQLTSIGETYDMYGMSAAHTTLPIPSYAKVTNLQNNKSVIVRVNDRGPFMHERIIDLSYTAAAKLGLIGSGQGMVEVESLTPSDNTTQAIAPLNKEATQVTPLPAAAINKPTPPTGTIYLQLGAFKSATGAEKFLKSMQTKLSDTGKSLNLLNINGFSKVRIGPYANKDVARTHAEKLKSRLGFTPVISLQ